ncbi:DUF2062 domain-containing protein [Rhodoferax sp. 4810]|uniref:DUF2062 domain-containing protein n=1 Tax=Thiospirillum jenense TaxID=1653858 RepID=A0A839H9Q1_9GAMM|nr:DUF2062 domain-containing protein [Thiospirillum jenense]MBB1073488.1 DUF2062 domain-containing protein [Rhodoferax jenense]MBB1125975.1 DUF2062 domain-containing protein [Thiospirillum jenense]
MKHWLKHRLPTRHTLLGHASFQGISHLFKDPNLWHFNRRSVAGATALGLFVMYLPMMGQMFIAAAAAIKLRVNLPIAVVLAWVTNPITAPPMFYAAYLLGCWLLGQPAQSLGDMASFWLDWHHWLNWQNWAGVLAPFLLGCLICATAGAALGYFIVITLWRWHLIQHLRQRRARYLTSTAVNKSASERRG